MKTNIIIILFVLSVATAWGLNRPDIIKLGDWSSSASFVWPIESAISTENHILSPDGKWKGIIQDHNLILKTNKNNVKNNSAHKIYLDGLAEIGWASDSSGLFLMRSDGGWVGSWYASVILMKDPKQKEIDVSRNVQKKCLTLLRLLGSKAVENYFSLQNHRIIVHVLIWVILQAIRLRCHPVEY